MKQPEHTSMTQNIQDPGTSSRNKTPADTAPPGASPTGRKRPGLGSRGLHVRAMVLEAMEILRNEGYMVGRINDTEIPFDIIGLLGRATLLVTVAPGQHTVRTAVEVAQKFRADIRKIQPFWIREADNFQFWVFSRMAGLLRYRVYPGGIWNETTRNGPDRKTLPPVFAGLQKRSGSLPVLKAGLAAGPD